MTPEEFDKSIQMLMASRGKKEPINTTALKKYQREDLMEHWNQQAKNAPGFWQRMDARMMPALFDITPEKAPDELVIEFLRSLFNGEKRKAINPRDIISEHLRKSGRGNE